MTNVHDGVKVNWPGVPGHIEAYIHTGQFPALVLWDEATKRHCAVRLDYMTAEHVRAALVTLGYFA